MRRASATARASTSTPPVACSSRSTAATSCTRTGRSSTRPQQGFDLPAEVVFELKKDAWYGWPKCYYDAEQEKDVLAPEYGGDGGKAVGECAKAEPPVAAFPAHWAPNDLKIYKSEDFPAGYRGGAFIAFHGSWNRAPGPQGGYNVVFQPLKDGKPSGDYIVFADGFAGAHKDPGRAVHRPSGLAVGPYGALYVSDDVGGRIWRITYEGDPDAKGIEAAPAPKQHAAASPDALPPEGIHPDAGNAPKLPVPPGATQAQVDLGEKVFSGEVAGATCAGCHGTGGIGTPVGPNLTSGKWLWGDGSLASLTATIDQRCARAEATSRRHAADGRRRVIEGRSRRRLRLRLGHRASGREVGLPGQHWVNSKRS